MGYDQCSQFHFEPLVTHFYFGNFPIVTHNQTAPRPVWHFDVTRVTRVSQAEIENTGYENLQWRRKLISDTVTKVIQGLLRDWTTKVKAFGTSSTIFMTNSESSWGLERTIDIAH